MKNEWEVKHKSKFSLWLERHVNEPQLLTVLLKKNGTTNFASSRFAFFSSAFFIERFHATMCSFERHVGSQYSYNRPVLSDIVGVREWEEGKEDEKKRKKTGAGKTEEKWNNTGEGEAVRSGLTRSRMVQTKDLHVPVQAAETHGAERVNTYASPA